MTSGHVLLQGNNVNVSCLGTLSASSVLAKKIEPLSEGIDIINTILPCYQSISALSSKCACST